jgi:dual specificity tyrosine-phosphorylation-regulated kinase 2/3/4
VPAEKKIQTSPSKQPNFGWDDERGDYRLVFNDHVSFRFEIKEVLGKGSFGICVKVFDHKRKIFIALKMI